MLKLYNTLTRKLDNFKPLDPSLVTYYSCGPTVYDFAHIGHARTYIFADILQRVLELDGFKVKRVMNITDVGHLTSDADSGEDKLEKASKKENKSAWDIARFYTDDFMQMLQKLNIIKPQIICKATDHISSMIRIIELLEKKAFTYRIDDGIYFDTSKLPHYGILTGQTFDKLQKTLKAGARVEMVTGKKHPTDFALWKFSYPNGRSFDLAQDDVSKKRQMEWDSPWGKGFPGWHIECSAMSMEYLGDTIDIHTGGVDHIPIHHTNEIAQSEAATGKPFVRYWLHADHLLVERQKMSKSLGNFYRVADLTQKGYVPLALRYLFLTAHYRTQLNFTWKALDGAQKALNSLIEQISNIQQRSSTGQTTNNFALYKKKFSDAVNNDLNMPQALAVVWEAVKSRLSGQEKYVLITLFDKVLGLNLRESGINHAYRQAGNKELIIPEEITKLVEERELIRKEKKWEESDKVRQVLEKQGYQVEDTPDGPKVKKLS